jgi:homoserine acetyltransferase
VPVWVVGTSKGTVSAVNAAARLKDGVDGLVITSSITRTSAQTAETVFDAGLADVRAPTLVVHHESDACFVTPAADASALIGRVRAARKELRLFQGGAGGASGERACGPFAAHGYYGIDAEVVTAIAEWIKATPPPR